MVVSHICEFVGICWSAKSWRLVDWSFRETFRHCQVYICFGNRLQSTDWCYTVGSRTDYRHGRPWFWCPLVDATQRMRYLISRVLMRESLSGGAHARSEVLVSDDSAGLTISFRARQHLEQHRNIAKIRRELQEIFKFYLYNLHLYLYIILFVLFF